MSMKKKSSSFSRAYVMESIKTVLNGISKPLRQESPEKCTGPSCKTCEKHQLGLFDSSNSAQGKTAADEQDQKLEIPWKEHLSRYMDPEKLPFRDRKKPDGEVDEPIQGFAVVPETLDAAPKCDLLSMEHPMFALKPGDKEERVYEYKGTTINMRPGLSGLATIHDKDIWIFCIAQLVESRNRNRGQDSRTVRFKALDFLKATDRNTGGQGYKELLGALRRLSETRVETNIETDGHNVHSGFGLIDSWSIVANKESKRMEAISVTLPEYLFQAITNERVLTLDQGYFAIRGALERRLYELARKHCGVQREWSISISALYKKSGSKGTERRFKGAIKDLVGTSSLPRYRLSFDNKSGVVTFSLQNEGKKRPLFAI